MTTIFDTISKKDLAEMPKVLYEGPITTVISETEAAKVFKALKNYRTVGIDTETRPSFKKGKINHVALLQIATEDCCWLIRLNRTGITNEIKDFLEDKDIIKIGLSLKDDFRLLNKSRNFKPESYIELQQYVGNFGIKDKSLQKIYAILFRQKISKSQRLTNWEADELTESQKRYAATDAWACIKIYNTLKEMETSHDYIIVNNTETTNKEIQE